MVDINPRGIKKYKVKQSWIFDSQWRMKMSDMDFLTKNKYVTFFKSIFKRNSEGNFFHTYGPYIWEVIYVFKER